jgi:hypothetical protein
LVATHRASSRDTACSQEAIADHGIESLYRTVHRLVLCGPKFDRFGAAPAGREWLGNAMRIVFGTSPWWSSHRTRWAWSTDRRYRRGYARFLLHEGNDKRGTDPAPDIGNRTTSAGTMRVAETFPGRRLRVADHSSRSAPITLAWISQTREVHRG